MSDDPRLMHHEYDGIREYDNPTPAWWHAIFVLTILFSILYFVYYQFSPVADSIEDRWSRAQVAEYKRIFGQVGELTPDEPTVVKMMADPQMLAVARSLFIGNCAACHGQDGGGINGVNLTDNSYKNVKRLGDILGVISKGANSGAMPAWENRLGQNERIILAAFVATLRGTSPAAPRPAEGVEIPAWGPGGN